MSVSLPQDFIDRVETQFGNAANGFTAALANNPVLSVRLNNAKPANIFSAQQPVPWCDQGRYLKERPLFTLDPLFHAGCYYPQEASSMFLHHVLTHILPNTEDAFVLDLCAAPGGKSTLIASYLNGDGLLVANETIRARANILAENCVKWGYPNVFVTQSDPSRFSQLPGFFDVVVVDAPCSGEGMFRKDEKARTEWSVANADLCAARQKRIVADVWPSVKEGGYLVYSTCTFNPAENEDNITWLLNQFDAEVVSFNVPPEWNIEQLPIGDGFGCAFYPHKVLGEGFFCAIVRKTGSEVLPNQARRDKKGTKGNFPKIDLPAGLLANQSLYKVIAHFNDLVAVPSALVDAFQSISSALYLIQAPITMGVIIKGDFVPNQALAMSIARGDAFSMMELSKDVALNYLRGDTDLGVDIPKGWFMVGYEGFALGFVKGIGNRINNYYPKEWRIRMR
jgi:16S rRNA C967 or C1407 C5-methylase (RsmB/RsmF family)/NOL1/NOP2/fmu family ribosome biogenesis protein